MFNALKRFLCGVAATALAMVLALTGSAAPAQAVGIDQIKRLGDKALSLYLQARGGELTEEQLFAALLEFAGVVSEAEDAIISHLDAIAAAPWVGAAEHAILEVDSLPYLTEDTREEYALDVALQARQAKSVFDAVASDAEADHLGFAIYSLYAVGLEARIAAGIGTSNYMPNYRAAMQAIVDRLEPRCVPSEGDMDYHPSIYHRVWTCSTPVGTRVFQDYQVNGEWREGPWTEQTVKDAAGAGTSWDFARGMLRQMDNGGI